MPTEQVTSALVAHELRETVGRLVRRLRTEPGPPVARMTVLSRLDREGPASISDLAAAERMRPQSMAQTVGDLEREVLGVEREDDLPGWMIPDAWFSYLRTNRSARVARAFRHNELDIVSMAALGAEVGSSRTALATKTRNTNVVTMTVSLGPGVGTGALTEAGVFDAGAAGNMHLSQTFSVINKAAGDTLDITWTWTPTT